MRLDRIVLGPMLLAFVVACVAAAGPTPADDSPALRFADGQDVSSLNPFLATSANILPLSEATMAYFTRVDGQGRIVPELLTELPSRANGGVSADGRRVTWHLRRGVRWSDGAPFDARDVVYTYRVARDPANTITARREWERLAGVDAPDPYTVVFRFKRPYALYLEYFASTGVTAILPEHALGPGTAIDTAPYNALPVGIGPYRYVAYHRGDDVEMETNPFYWRGRPKLARIDYKIVTDENTMLTQLQTGELGLWDIINGPLVARIKTLPGIANHARLSNYIELIVLNEQRPVPADPLVRQALALATNRTEILTKAALGNGVVLASLEPPIVEGYAAQPIAYDPARAQALLDRAGWRRGPDGVRRKNGTPLAIELAIPTGQETRETTAELLREAWGAIGVEVTIRPWAASVYFAPAAANGVLQGGRFDAAIAARGLGPTYAEIDGAYDCASIAPRGQNLSRGCDPRLDALDDRYVQSFDRRARIALAAQMQRLLAADVPSIALYDRTFVSAYDARLRGYAPNAFSYWGDPLQLQLAP